VTRAPSLRTTLLAGLVLLNLAVVGGIVATVYARARREAHAALRADLRLRAETLAGLLELDPDGIEFELSPKVLPEYMTPGSGAYAVIYDADGNAVPGCRSPSLSGKDLPRAAPWSGGGTVFDELAQGPDGFPCAAVTRSFLVRVEKGGPAGWQPPPEERLRHQIVVAADSRPRDAGLAALLATLAGTAAVALCVTVLGGLIVARRVLAPVERMTAEAAALTPGDTSRRLEPETVSRELASLSTTLNSALDRLGDALDRQRRFTSDASHELRTPLAVLRGNAELLLRRDRTPHEYREGLERQRRIAVRMTEITENLLALARADGGRAEIRRSRVDLPGLTRSVCDEFADMAGEDGVALECAADEELAVDGDPTYLAGLVQNLVSNALKFTPRGGSVRVAVARENGHAVLDVADTGPGIPEQDRARVFQRFFRVNEGRDRHEGAGLGLAIVEWIVREHAGRIDVLDREGGGTLFRVRLPLGAAPAADRGTE
jgi:heavy metal sensor kinase